MALGRLRQPTHHALFFLMSNGKGYRWISPCQRTSIVVTSAGRGSSAPKRSPITGHQRRSAPSAGARKCPKHPATFEGSQGHCDAWGWMNIDVAHVNWFSTYHVGLQTAFTRDVRFCWAMPAHIHSPVTGIGDAVNLAWKLAAVLWRPPTAHLPGLRAAARLPNSCA